MPAPTATPALVLPAADPLLSHEDRIAQYDALLALPGLAPMAYFHAWQGRARAERAADDAAFLADPVAYRLRSDYHHEQNAHY